MLYYLKGHLSYYEDRFTSYCNPFMKPLSFCVHPDESYTYFIMKLKTVFVLDFVVSSLPLLTNDISRGTSIHFHPVLAAYNTSSLHELDLFHCLLFNFMNYLQPQITL